MPCPEDNWEPLTPEEADTVPDYEDFPLPDLNPQERMALALEVLAAMPYRHGGFSDEELAEIAGVSRCTVIRFRSDALAKLALNHSETLAPFLKS